MNFYCYVPQLNGVEPYFLDKKMVFKADSLQSARQIAMIQFGIRARLFFYINFFERKTFTQISL